MISWGVVRFAMMSPAAHAAFTCYVVCSGLRKRDFFPGIIFYLTHWFPSRERARAISLFMTATQIAGVIGGPLSGVLLAMNGVWHLAGWQWLFLAEGIPAVLLGAAARQISSRWSGARDLVELRRTKHANGAAGARAWRAATRTIHCAPR